MNLKPWQTIVLGLISLPTICVVCAIGVVVIGAFIPGTPEPVARAPEIELPTSTPLPTQTQTPIATASPTITPTETPTATHTPQEFSIPRTGPASCIPANAQVSTGIVSKVVDGDSIEVVIGDVTLPLRYIGIDTPEYGAQFAAQASAANAGMVEGQQVTLLTDVSEHDRYNRLLRYVFVGQTFVNYELVRGGWAQAVSYPPDTACDGMFGLAQTEAQSERIGMWVKSAETPQAPPALIPLPSPRSGGAAACNCSGPDLDCGHFGTHAKAQACYDYCRSLGLGDVFNLDGDHDGLACESLP